MTGAGGVPLSGVSVTVSGDEVKDGEGNYLLGVSPTAQTSGFGESATKRTATVTTASDGLVQVKVSTATFSSVDCASARRDGVLSVSVASVCGVVVTSFTYAVYDAAPLACV